MRRRSIALVLPAVLVMLVVACNALTGAGDLSAHDTDASSPAQPTVNGDGSSNSTGASSSGVDGAIPPLSDSSGGGGGGGGGDDAATPPNPDSSTATTYAAMILSDGPAAYWRFDEPTGATKLIDSSGNGNDLTISSSGPGGKTLAFGQPGAIVNDPSTCVALPGSLSLLIGDKFDFGKTPYTIEAWIRPSPSNEYRQIFSKMQYDSNNQPMTGTYLFVFDPKEQIGFERYITSAAADQAASATRVPSQNFQHVVATSDGVTASIYIDGVFGGSDKAGTSPPVTVPATLGVNYQGSLDEVAIYLTALSAARVKAHYDMGTTGKAL